MFSLKLASLCNGLCGGQIDRIRLESDLTQFKVNGSNKSIRYAGARHSNQKAVQTFPVLSGMTNSRAALNLNITLGITNGSTPLPGRGLEVWNTPSGEGEGPRELPPPRKIL